MPRYLFISAPADPTKKATVTGVRSAVGEAALVSAVDLPAFKVGTLDALYVLADELLKHDAAFESQTWKIADFYKSLLNAEDSVWRKNLVIGNRGIEQYLAEFRWNSMKYRTDRPLQEITQVIIQEVNSIDTLMKNKMQAYSQMKGQLQGLQRSQTGNLSVRSLNNVVKKEHFVLGSEYLATVLVAVPLSNEKEWIGSYETLTQMVVPRSSQRITEDADYALYSATLFKRVVDEFTVKAREMKFIVRDFVWDEDVMRRERKEMLEAGAAEKEQSATLLRLCKTNFGELFSCWIHIKAIRVFVESILRHGLPPNSQAMMVACVPKQEGKVADILKKHFAHLDRNHAVGTSDENDSEMLMIMGDTDFTPHVQFPIVLPS